MTSKEKPAGDESGGASEDHLCLDSKTRHKQTGEPFMSVDILATPRLENKVIDFKLELRPVAPRRLNGEDKRQPNGEPINTVSPLA
jgi:hypothetical protein